MPPDIPDAAVRAVAIELRQQDLRAWRLQERQATDLTWRSYVPAARRALAAGLAHLGDTRTEWAYHCPGQDKCVVVEDEESARYSASRFASYECPTHHVVRRTVTSGAWNRVATVDRGEWTEEP